MNEEVNKDTSVEMPITTESMNKEVEVPVTTISSNEEPSTPVVEEQGIKKIINNLKNFGIGKIIGIAVIVLAIVAVSSYTVISSNPKFVFKNSIHKVYKEANKTIDAYEDFKKEFDLAENAIKIKGSVGFDTNVKELQGEEINLKDFTFSIEAGLDIKEEQLEASGKIKGPKEEINGSVYYLKNKAYLESNLLEGLVLLEEDLDIDFSEIADAFNEVDKVDTKDMDYLVKTVTDALGASLNSKYMSKSSDDVKINGNKTKVTKYSYKLNESAVQDLVKSFTKELLDDKKFIKTAAKVFDVDKDDVKEALENMKKEAKNIDMGDDKVVINLFTRGILNQFAGFSLSYNKEEYVTYYTDGKNFELNIEADEKIKVTGEDKKDVLHVSIEVDEEEIATLKVKELSDKKVDFTFEVPSEDISGSIYLTTEHKKQNVNGDYEVKIEYEEEYISVKGSYGIEVSKELDSINTKNAIDSDEVDEEKVFEKFEEIAKKDTAFKTIYESAYDSWEESNLNLNYDGLAVIRELSEVKKILNRQKPTVLYVGSSYYPSYETEAYNLYKNLLSVQKELDFHSYFYHYTYVNDEFKELVKDVPMTCTIKKEEIEEPEEDITLEENSEETNVEEKTCKEYPVLYFIKDGKVVASLQGTASIEELKSSLKEIGIE